MNTLISIWGWLMGHQAIVGGALVGVVDLLIAIKQSWAASGILHAILLFGQKLMGNNSSNPPSPPAAS